MENAIIWKTGKINHCKGTQKQFKAGKLHTPKMHAMKIIKTSEG